MKTLEQVRDESYKRDIDKSPSGEPSQWIYNAGWDACLAHLSAQAGEFDEQADDQDKEILKKSAINGGFSEEQCKTLFGI